MKKKSADGSQVQEGLNLSDKKHLKLLAFTLTAHDLELDRTVQIVGNSRLTKDGPIGVIVFVPGATVGNNGMIEFALAISKMEIANAESEIANAEV